VRGWRLRRTLHAHVSTHAAHHGAHTTTHRIHPHAAHGSHRGHAHHVGSHTVATTPHPARSSAHAAAHHVAAVVEAAVVLHASHRRALEATAHRTTLEAAHRTGIGAVCIEGHVVRHSAPIVEAATTATEASHVVHAEVHVLVHGRVEAGSCSPRLLILAHRSILRQGAEGVGVRVGVVDGVLPPRLAACTDLLDLAFSGRRGLRCGKLDECLAVERAWLVTGTRYPDPLCILPFTLAVHFMFAESYILELIFAASLVDPAADVVVRCPPIQVGN